MDLNELLTELKERRWKAAHHASAAPTKELLANLATLQSSVAAVEAVIAENRVAPQPVELRVWLIE